jgi:hypothetical protein
MPTVLNRELAAYEREKARLLKEHEGKFVLIVGDDVIGIFDTQFAAIDEGWKLFPGKPILTKKITPTEEVVFIPRRVAGR